MFCVWGPFCERMTINLSWTYFVMNDTPNSQLFAIGLHLDVRYRSTKRYLENVCVIEHKFFPVCTLMKQVFRHRNTIPWRLDGHIIFIHLVFKNIKQNTGSYGGSLFIQLLTIFFRIFLKRLIAEQYNLCYGKWDTIRLSVIKITIAYPNYYYAKYEMNQSSSTDIFFKFSISTIICHIFKL